MVQLNRRQFLRGDVKGKLASLRPPWSVEEGLFIERCDRCARCVDACPQRLLKSGSGGFPEIDFTVAECTFCGACVDSCPSQALNRGQSRAAWVGTLTIEDACLALRGVDCRVCGEQCEHRVIRFVPVLRGVARPHLEPDACTGCGACIGPCPVSAMRFSTNNSKGNPQP